MPDPTIQRACMLRLIVKSLINGFGEKIAELENRIALVQGDCYAEPLDAEQVEGWFTGASVDPEEYALLVINGRLAGYAWAWSEEDGFLSFASIRVDPLLPRDLYEATARILLSWARLSLEEWQEARGPVEVRLGSLAGQKMEILHNILPGIEEYRVSSILMRLEEPRIQPAGRYALEELDPAANPEHASLIAEIYNDAFRDYEGFLTWTPSEAHEYYKRKAKKYPVKVLLAKIGGEPAGFIEVYPYTSVCGKRIGYVSLLAVARRYQGRGLGTLLLAHALNVLQQQKVSEIILFAVPKVAGLYYKLGFRPLRLYVKSRIPLYHLPKSIPSIEYRI